MARRRKSPRSGTKRREPAHVAAQRLSTLQRLRNVRRVRERRKSRSTPLKVVRVGYLPETPRRPSTAFPERRAAHAGPSPLPERRREVVAIRSAQCKDQPDPAKAARAPRRRGRGGSPRKFIPWCTTVRR